MSMLLDLRQDGLTAALSSACAMPCLALELRAFPDGEWYIRLPANVSGQQIVIIADLSRPDRCTLALLLLCRTLRAQGAARIGLVAPYLPYMRQDRAFNAGESITSRHFAELLSSHIDWLLTVDAHLHRYASLQEIYSIDARNLSAAQPLAQWIGEHVQQPLLVGPDEESAQWVSAAAARLDCPWRVLEKQRSGDRSVRISGRIDEALRGRTPVLVDDMISTGRTLVEGCRVLRDAGMAAPLVVAVHGIFAGDAFEALQQAGAARIVSSNSIPHPSNAIDLAALLAGALRVGIHLDV